MRLPPVPGPHDLVRLVERGTEAVTALLEAAPRLAALLDEAEELLGRAGTTLDRLEATRVSADEVVRRTDAIVTRAEATVVRVDSVADDAKRSITRVDSVADDAKRSITRVDSVVGEAERAVDTTDSVIGRVEKLLDAMEPSLTTLQPTLERLADTTHPEEVDALVALVDSLPVLADRMQGEVIPIVKSLQNVGPDIHDLLDLTRALNEMLAAVPGLGRVKKRIDEEQAENGDG